jgi:hypothetical protein
LAVNYQTAIEVFTDSLISPRIFWQPDNSATVSVFEHFLQGSGRNANTPGSRGNSHNSAGIKLFRLLANRPQPKVNINNITKCWRRYFGIVAGCHDLRPDGNKI